MCDQGPGKTVNSSLSCGSKGGIRRSMEVAKPRMQRVLGQALVFVLIAARDQRDCTACLPWNHIRPSGHMRTHTLLLQS